MIFRSILFCIVFTGLLALFSFFKNQLPEKFERFAYGIIGTAVALLTSFIFLRFEKKSFADIGLKWEKNTLKRFLLGLLIGLLLCSLIMASLFFFTSLKIGYAGNYSITGFLIWSLALVPLAFMEELAFRAYPFFNLQKAAGIRVTQVVIAVLFALYHVAGGQSFFSSFMGAGIWAFVFGMGMILSGGISLPTGIHVGVNFILAALGQHRGFPVLLEIQPPAEMTPAIQNNIDNTGNTMQVILLVLTLLLMEWYIRRNKNPGNTAL